ncbi:MAG: hypothetical protein K5656_03515 [Lachnospiraceae bacterium]|nr:hypothetical protein [Lachnospiraceae bacterium]
MIFSDSDDGVIDLNEIEEDDDGVLDLNELEEDETKDTKKKSKKSKKSEEDKGNMTKEQKAAFKKREAAILDAELGFTKTILEDDDFDNEYYKANIKFLLDVAEKYKKTLLKDE